MSADSISERVAVLERALRDVIDVGRTNCDNFVEASCFCPSHVRARQVWDKAEALLNGTIDGPIGGVRE